MAPSPEMSMMDVFHKHHHKDQENDKSRYFIEKIQYFIHENNLKHKMYLSILMKC
jgi:hypothetical protein